MRKPFVLIGFLILYACSTLKTQPAFGGIPLGLSSAKATTSIPAIHFQSPDFQKLEAEDERTQVSRFAAPVLVDIKPEYDGKWTTTADGTSVWQLRIKIPDAKGLLLFYEDFALADDARLFVYSADGQQILGAYTQASMGKSDRFMTGIIYGEEVVLEYQMPQIASRSPFHIFRIDVVYKNIGTEKAFPETGFGASSTCHDNVVCSTGDDWVIERNAVARIYLVVEEGTGYCSGTLMNNTAEDGRLLFLSAFHCMDGYTPQYDLWRFDFEYASSTCINPTTEPTFKSILGCDLLAGRRDNDFLLLDLYPQIPDGLQLHLAGWDRRDINPTSGAVVHHPLGDIQKIAISSTASTVFPSSINWNNGLVITPADHHFKTTYSDGTIEQGSSGAALFNQEHKVVAQLQGAGDNINCDETFGYFGRLFMSWEGGGTPATRLKDWLDPLDSNAVTINAFSSLRSPNILTDTGDPVPSVSVRFYVNDALVGTTESMADGRIPIPDNFPLTGTLRMEFAREISYDNGVTTSDLIKIQKHILGIGLLDALKTLACDVNGSNSLTTLDMIRIRKLILTLNSDFGDGSIPSWLFFTAPFSAADPLEPWDDNGRSNSFIYQLVSGFQLPNFVAVKSGDANGNVDPG